MTAKTTNFDAVVASAPANATAAVVTAGSRTHYESSRKVVPEHVHTDIRPPLKDLRRLDRNARATAVALVGKRIGRLTVIGIREEPKRFTGGTKRKARWVVRCDCGRYEHRLAKALREPKLPDRAMCSECLYQVDRRRFYAEDGPRPLGEFLGAAEESEGAA